MNVAHYLFRRKPTFCCFQGAHQRWWQLRTQTLQLYEKLEPITAEPETDGVGICFWCDERY